MQPELRWFWSITIIGARHAGIRTSGRAPTLEEAQGDAVPSYRSGWSGRSLKSKSKVTAGRLANAPESIYGSKVARA